MFQTVDRDKLLSLLIPQLLSSGSDFSFAAKAKSKPKIALTFDNRLSPQRAPTYNRTYVITSCSQMVGLVGRDMFSNDRPKARHLSKIRLSDNSHQR